MPGRTIILRYMTAKSGGDQEVAGHRAGEREMGEREPISVMFAHSPSLTDGGSSAYATPHADYCIVPAPNTAGGP